MTTSPQRNKKLQRRYSSGSQDAVLASLTNRQHWKKMNEDNLYPFPSVSLGKRADQNSSLAVSESRPLHIYDRIYLRDGLESGAEAHWRKEPVRRGRSTSVSDVPTNGDIPDHLRLRARYHSPPTAYASLPATPTESYGSNNISIYPTAPPTPLLEPPPPPPRRRRVSGDSNVYEPTPPFSLWDYLREEILATDFDSHQELKWERVSNFLNIPLAMEKACLFVHMARHTCSRITPRSLALGSSYVWIAFSTLLPYYPFASVSHSFAF